MRAAWLSLVVVGCSSPAPKRPVPKSAAPAPAQAHAEEDRPDALVVAKPTPLAADTPQTTVAGNPFIAPAGWTVEVRGAATIVTPPEGNSHIALVDVAAKDYAEALDLAWKAYKPDHAWPVLMTTDAPDHEGWSKIKNVAYQTSPNEKRDVGAFVAFANGMWTVVLVDFDQAVGDKRGAQLALVFSRLQPKGHERELFVGKKPHPLDAEHVALLTKFVGDAEKQLGVPGVGFGLIENGKVVFAGGVGVRELGKPAKVDGNTAFMIASNTKALTTLLLAKLVDNKQLTWDTPVTQLLATFALGDPETTKQVLVKHLICACTGMPREDLELLLQFKGVTPEQIVALLGTQHPTSKFGEIFQYSNIMAGVAGFVGGHVAFPKLELGAAYDKAMQTLVFDPLGMKATTFDYARALRGDHAMPFSEDLDGKIKPALFALDYSPIPWRGAGAAWSTVNDMLRYIQMELAEGQLPNGKRYIGKDALLARRAPQVPIGKDLTYGMGLMVDTRYGTPIVHHGGDLIGFHSDMMWLPEYGVGAVVLTNGDQGAVIRDQFLRKLLEVLFDGKPEADAAVAAAAKEDAEGLAVERKQVAVPADAADAGKLAPKYHNAALGDLAVKHVGSRTIFDFGEFQSEVGTKHNPDGTVSFVTVAPGFMGVELVAGAGGLTIRDAQHEYLFAAAK